MFTKRQDIPSGKITLQGWASEFLNRQETGLTGHPKESGFPFNTGMWTELMDVGNREFEGGSDWWPYEQTAYYLDGALRCAYIKGSKILLENVRKNIHHVIDNADSDGRLRAGDVEDDSWPMVVFMRMLFEEYNNTSDPELLAAIEKHYRAVYSQEENFEFKKGSDFNIRPLLHVEHLCRLSDITGDDWFLKTAERLYELFTKSAADQNDSGVKVLTAKGMAEGLVPNGHGVTYHEFLKIPAVLYSHTGKEIYREAIEHAFFNLSETHELSSGLSSAVEELSGKKSNLAHEVCNVSDFNWACGWALLATGEAKYADKMEKVLYNAGFCSVTSDFKAHQYYSAPNLPISADTSSFYNDDASWGQCAKARLCYRPGHDTECCSGNIHRMLPTFVNRMCLLEPDAVSVVFYIPSTVEIPFDGETLKMTQVTSYPFEHSLQINIDTAPAKELALRLRVPGWAKSYKITLNGQELLKGHKNSFFAELKRVFKSGDKIDITFEASPAIDDRERGLSINYGPLVFSFPVPTKKTLTTDDGAGKCSSEFPAYQLIPLDPNGWAYALSENLSVDDLKLIKFPAKGYPWDYGNSPVKIKVPARKVKNWKLSGGTSTSDFPKTLELDDKDIDIVLEPMGSTLLRMTELPKDKF